MVERDYSNANPMLQFESGLESEDVWWDMVYALQRQRDIDVRHGVTSRGRHHRPDSNDQEISGAAFTRWVEGSNAVRQQGN